MCFYAHCIAYCLYFVEIPYPVGAKCMVVAYEEGVEVETVFQKSQKIFCRLCRYLLVEVQQKTIVYITGTYLGCLFGSRSKLPYIVATVEKLFGIMHKRNHNRFFAVTSCFVSYAIE